MRSLAAGVRRRVRRRTGKPPSERLIHVGPHKTGTTTVQSAFHLNRGALADHGIHYVGARLQPANAVKAMTGVGSSGDVRAAGLKNWADLMSAARTSGAETVVISSEFLSEADDAAARQIVEDLGGPSSTRVVVTLRPLATIIPSQWQQFVQSGTTDSLEDWVEAVLANDASRSTVALFWRRHRHDVLVRRWADVVGAQNVTVIVGDPKDRDQLTREFARLLSIPDGLLVPDPGRANRSLTGEEIDGILTFNRRMVEIDDARAARGQRRMWLTVEHRLEMWRQLKRREPAADEERIVLPKSAAERVAALSAEFVDDIRAAGVQVVGHLESLAAPLRAS